MGDYCTLRFEAILNEVGLYVASRLEYGANWEQILVEFPQLELHPRWMTEPRKSFIPFGAVQYVPKGWDGIHRNEVGTGVWRVQCSVKTVATVSLFAELVLPHFIVEDTEIEWEHEYPFEKGTFTARPLAVSFAPILPPTVPK